MAISSRASSPSSQLGTMTRASRRATGAANAAPWESDARSGWIVASALMPTSAPPTTAMDPFNPPVTTRRLMRSRVPRSRESNGPLGFSGSGSSPSGDGPPLPLMDRSRVSFVVVGSKGFPSASGSFPSPSSEEALGTIADRPPNRRDPRRGAGDLRTLAPETTARALIAHRALIADASPGAISSLNPCVSSTGPRAIAPSIMMAVGRAQVTSRFAFNTSTSSRAMMNWDAERRPPAEPPPSVITHR